MLLAVRVKRRDRRGSDRLEIWEGERGARAAFAEVIGKAIFPNQPASYFFILGEG